MDDDTPKTKVEAKKLSYGNRTHVGYTSEQCAKRVTRYYGNWPSFGQCRRKPGHGPEKLYCKQHDPAEVEKREYKRQKKWDKEWENKRMEFSGKRFYDVLKTISDGHNNARLLAKETLENFHGKGSKND